MDGNEKGTICRAHLGPEPPVVLQGLGTEIGLTSEGPRGSVTETFPVLSHWICHLAALTACRCGSY